MKAPKIKHYISWLGRVGYRNIDCSFSYDEASTVLWSIMGRNASRGSYR